MNDKIKVLHYIPGFKFGGIESRMLDILKRIDKSKFQFDFMILTNIENSLIDEIEKYGGRVYTIAAFTPKTIFRHIKEMEELIDRKKYDIIHCHSNSTGFILLRYAKKKGIKGRILHARTSSFKGSSLIPVRELMKKLSINYSNKYLAVSHTAGKWFFGNAEFEVIPNSIELEKYVFSISDRESVREYYNIKDEIIFGHVGRNTYAKNHKFLFEIFSEIIKERPNSKLMLVGVDYDDENLVKYAKELGILDKIIMCGFQEDVSKFYSAMDALIFPSFYEGLPGTLIEAQVSGLGCYCSDVITNEVSLTDNIRFMKLDESSKHWAEEILFSLNRENRKSHVEEIENKGYSLKQTVASFERIYYEILR